MAFSTMDDIVAALSAQERVPFFKQAIAQGSAGAWVSLWKIAGAPGAAATPASGAGAAPTNATAGAMKFTDPSGANHKRLLSMVAAATQRGTLALIDRLVHTSGMSGTVTTAQTVNSAALPSRDANGATAGDGVEAWLEVYTALGATSRTATVSYTNSAGTAGQSGTATIPASAPAGRMIPITLAAGDTGVQSVQTVTLSGTTGTAGDFGVTLLRNLIDYDLLAVNLGANKGPFECAMPRTFVGTCLAMMAQFDSSTSASLSGELVLGEK